MREGVLRRAGLAAATLLSLGRAPLWAADDAGGAPPPAAAPAASEAPPAIGGTSSCPSPNAVWAELITLVPRERLEEKLRGAGGGPAPAVEIVDLGVPYRIRAAGQLREYRDESRDCTHRARIAAVFVALAIDPAPLPVPAPPPPVAPPAPAPAAPPPRPLPLARFDLGATAQGGLGPSGRTGHLGLELRWSGGRRAIGPEAGVLALLPADNTIGGVRLRQWRLPIDAGVRARATGPRVAGYGELGVSAALLSERALDLAAPKSQTGFEIGLRASVGIHAARARLAPFAALAAELVPVPPSVFALPAGTLGHTPRYWIGATAGVSLGVL